MPRTLPTDRRAHARLTWRARVVTGLALVPCVYFAVAIVLAQRSPDQQVRATAAWSFLWLGLWLLAGWWACWRAWSASRAARPVVQQLADLGSDSPSGAARGVPDLHAPSGPHASLSGRFDPPRRW